MLVLILELVLELRTGLQGLLRWKWLKVQALRLVLLELKKKVELVLLLLLCDNLVSSVRRGMHLVCMMSVFGGVWSGEETKDLKVLLKHIWYY